MRVLNSSKLVKTLGYTIFIETSEISAEAGMFLILDENTLNLSLVVL